MRTGRPKNKIKSKKVAGWGLFCSDGYLRDVFIGERPIPNTQLGYFTGRVVVLTGKT